MKECYFNFLLYFFFFLNHFSHFTEGGRASLSPMYITICYLLVTFSECRKMLKNRTECCMILNVPLQNIDVCLYVLDV